MIRTTRRRVRRQARTGIGRFRHGYGNKGKQCPWEEEFATAEVVLVFGRAVEAARSALCQLIARMEASGISREGCLDWPPSTAGTSSSFHTAGTVLPGRYDRLFTAPNIDSLWLKTLCFRAFEGAPGGATGLGAKEERS